MCSLTYFVVVAPGSSVSNVPDWKKMPVGSKWHQPGRRQGPTHGRTVRGLRFAACNHFRRQRRSRTVLAGYHAQPRTRNRETFANRLLASYKGVLPSPEFS